MYTLETAIYAILIAFFANIIISPRFIKFLTKLKFGQYVRDDGPESHLKKAGTPTMGGLIIGVSILIGSLPFLKGNTDGWAVIFLIAAFGAMGFTDDYEKIAKKQSLGLTAIQKIIIQIAITVLFLMYIIKSGIGMEIYIPFVGEYIELSPVIYIPFFVIGVLGTVNGVNLTDGLDGLVSGVTVIVAVFFGIIAWTLGSGTCPVAGAVIGALMGFLLFNSYPAKVFMGDTGSMGLGGFVVGMAFILKMPLFILIVGVVYLMECLSVMIQVASYKLRNGKRVFKMAPIHHHFELCGWSETKVVALFYIITAMACLIGFLAYTK